MSREAAPGVSIGIRGDESSPDVSAYLTLIVRDAHYKPADPPAASPWGNFPRFPCINVFTLDIFVSR